MLSIEQFRVQDRSQIAYAVAELVASEVFRNRLTPTNYIDHADELIGYGLVNPLGRLVGGATVHLGVEIAYGSFVTDLRTIAITPRLRGTGYGKLLLHHIANEAAERGDDSIELLPLETSIGFYTKLGFEPSEDEEDMLTIAPAVLLANLAANGINPSPLSAGARS